MCKTLLPPAITIVIPAFNEADIIGRCLDSIAAQTVMPSEVIVVDNGSTDDTASVAASYPFVTIITEPVKSRWAARKAGLAYAHTELVGQIDADSRLSPDWVATAQKLFLDDPSLHIVTGSGAFYNLPLRRLQPYLINTMYYRFQRLLSGQIVAWGANMVVRRKEALAICRSLPADNAYDEDILMSLMMRRHGHKTYLASHLRAEMSLRRSNMRFADTRRYVKKLSNNHRLMRQPHRARFVAFMSAGYLVTTVFLIAIYRFGRYQRD